MKKVIRHVFFLIAVLLISRYIEAQPKMPKGTIPDGLSADLRTVIEKLYSDDPEKRAEGASQLGNMGLYAIPAIPYLVDLLGDDYILQGNDDVLVKSSIGEICARSLALIGEPSVKYLVKVLAGSDIVAKRNAIFALGEINDPAVANLLISNINNDDPVIRKYVVKALGKYDHKRVVDSIITKLNDKDPDVREAAVEILAKKEDPRSALYFIDVLKDDDEFTQYLAVEALVKFNDERTISPLIEGLKSDNVNFRKNSAVILGTLKPPQAKQPLIDASNDSNPVVQGKIIWALAEYNDNDTRKLVVDKLSSTVPMIRSYAIEAVSKFKIDESAGSLIELLGDDDPDTQKQVVEAISKLKGDQINTVLLEKYKDPHENLRARSNAILVLGNRKSEEAKPYIISGLTDKEINIRLSAAQALGNYNDPNVTAVLLKSLETESNQGVIKKAVSALEQIADPLSMETLIKNLNHQDEEIKESAARTLIKITGQNFGFNVDQWEKWWAENKNNFVKK